MRFLLVIVLVAVAAIMLYGWIARLHSSTLPSHSATQPTIILGFS